MLQSYLHDHKFWNVLLKLAIHKVISYPSRRKYLALLYEAGFLGTAQPQSQGH